MTRGQILLLGMAGAAALVAFRGMLIAGRAQASRPADMPVGIVGSLGDVGRAALGIVPVNGGQLDQLGYMVQPADEPSIPRQVDPGYLRGAFVPSGLNPLLN